MKMNLTALVVAFCLLLSSSCGDKDKDCHKTISFNNSTLDSLYVVSSYHYPDTISFIGIPNPLLDPDFTLVLPNEVNSRVLWGSDCVESDFKHQIPSDTLIIYVFKSQILENIPWDTIKANYLVLKRYDLSLDDLNRMNWTITYP